MRKWIALCGVLLLLINGCTPTAKRATLTDGFSAVQRGDAAKALEIYESIAQQRRDTMEGALAMDAAIELSGHRLFPQSSYGCSREALAKYADAERQFVAGAMNAALDGYQKAVELCPENANWWIHSGDAYFGRGEYEHAKTLYLRGLQLDPWNRSGHRFLADCETHLGEAAQAYQSAVLAVVSDPTYEAGWQFLKELTRTLGGQWHRRAEPKPRIGQDNGKPTVTLSPFYETKASLTAWMAYGVMRWRFTEGPQTEPKTEGKESSAKLLSQEEWKRMSPVERERFLVSESLDLYAKFTTDNPGTTAVFWETFQKAAHAGFMDEAIYMHLMDGDLAPSYPTYRMEHTARLIEYVTKVIAPLPPSGSREA
jgi:tetratricopeptide (TPR) repeat protein